MTDTPIWLDAFPHDLALVHERTPRGLSKVSERVYYPGARRDGGRDGAGGPTWWTRATPTPGRGCPGRASATSRRPLLTGLAALLDDEVRLRSGDPLHRVPFRPGITVTERESW